MMKLRKMKVYVVTFLNREYILYQKIFKDYDELENFVCETIKSDLELLSKYGIIGDTDDDTDDETELDDLNIALELVLKQMKTNINNYDPLLPYRIYVSSNEI